MRIHRKKTSRRWLCGIAGVLASLIGLLLPQAWGAMPTEQDGWQIQTKTYYRMPEADPIGRSLTEVLTSDPFCGDLKPGSYRAFVSGWFDDWGTVGNVVAPGDGSFYPEVKEAEVTDSVTISNDRLQVNVSASDIPGGWVGWELTVVWMVKSETGCGSGGCTKGFGGASVGAGAMGGTIDFSINLGHTTAGQMAGQLMIRTNGPPSSSLATPQGLQVALGAGVDVITTNGVLRQMRTEEGLTDIVTNNYYSYEMRFYKSGEFTAVTSNGLFWPLVSPPITTITVENPDGASSTNRLRISETGLRGNKSSMYTWNAATQQWQLSSEDTGRIESTSVQWDGAFRTDTSVVSNATGAVAFKQIRKYQAFAWGTNLIEAIVDGSPAKTNKWFYYDNAAATNTYSRVRMTIAPSGYWERYNYDSLGRVTEIVAQFLNAPTNATTGCRVTSYSYVEGFSSVTRIDGCTVASNSRVISGEQETIQQGNLTTINQYYTNVVYTAPYTNMVVEVYGEETITNYYASSTNLVYNGPLRSTKQPDGTMTLYCYNNLNDAVRIITNETGIATGDEMDITNGTRTVQTVDWNGNVLTNQVIDIASELTIAQDIALAVDRLGRVTQTASLMGTSSVGYGCCSSVLTTNVSVDGGVTIRNYDALGRLVATTSNGITISNTYDIMDRQLATFRNGVFVSSNAYDTAGRLMSTTDALNRTTTYTETRNGYGETEKTTTYADNTTRVETYYQDGQLKSISGTAVRGVSYEYGVEQDENYEWQLYTKEIRSSNSNEWVKTYTDKNQRMFKTIFPDASYSQQYFYESGQLWKQRDPDGVVTLYTYNAKGELEDTAIAMDNPDGISYGGTDRITRTQRSVVSNQGIVRRRTTTTVWTTDNSEDTEVVNVTDTSADGLQSWQIAYGLTNRAQTVYDPANARRTVTATAPDGSYTVSVYENGRLASITAKDANGIQLSAVTNQYDAAGRLTTSTDARNGDTTYTYNNADQRLSMSVGGQTTSWAYDSMGRVGTNTLPDNAKVYFEYYATGELKKTSGARTYPVEYTYDYAGRMKTMKTWKNFAGNSETAITTWNYSTDRGFLTSKVYDDSSSVTYSNTLAGRLAGRTWARGITTTYAYNNAGDVSGIDYSDATPDVTFTYDRRGRRITATDGVGTNNFTYNSAGQLLTESFPNSSITVTNSYDSLLRRSAISGIGVSPVQFGYDAASRLSSVGQASQLVQYAYLPNSSLVSNITFKTGGALKMSTTKSYDNLNRLTQIRSVDSVSSVVSSHTYDYNSANQRTKRTDADNSYWDYTYDSLGQVTSGHRKWADNSSVAGQQYDYLFDDIGNRKTATLNGNTGTYTANSVNQYTQRTVPGFVDVIGTAASNATVTVNNQSTTRQSEYFHKQLSVVNSSAAVYTNISTVGVRKNAGTNQQDVVTTVTGKRFVAQTPESFTYDADGNMISDGRFAYVWDAENRLVSATSLTNAPTASKRKVEWTYDYQGRKIRQTIYDGSSGSYVTTADLKFVYDGWQCVAELTATNNTVVRSYVWGLDLSGTTDGAGGVGGLLIINSVANGVHFCAMDGNGNVSALVNTGDGITSAAYEYSPFGETIRATGVMARENAFRFSTKRTDDTTGIVLYEYRPYQPPTGLWLSRDPIAERQLAEKASEAPLTTSLAQTHDLDFTDEMASDAAMQPFPIEALLTAVGSGDLVANTWQFDGNSYLFCLNNAIIAIDPNGEYVQILQRILVIAPEIVPVVQRVSGRIVTFFQYNGARYSTWLAAAAARGTQIHQVWGRNLAGGWTYNQYYVGVGRPDAVNRVSRVIVELKPDNARAIQLGVRTLENRYIPGLNRTLHDCFNGQLRPYQIIEQPGQFTPWFQNAPTP